MTDELPLPVYNPKLGPKGYTDSQTWEAWADSMNVFWNNTELVLVFSIAISLGAIILTFVKFPRISLLLQQSKKKNRRDKPNGFDKHQPSKGKQKEDRSNHTSQCPLPMKPIVRVTSPPDSSMKKVTSSAPCCPFPGLKQGLGSEVVTCPFPDVSQIFDDELPEGPIVSKSKLITNEIQRRMSTDERIEEQQTQNEQLSMICQIMEEQQDKFGNTSINDIKNQMKFYCG